MRADHLLQHEESYRARPIFLYKFLQNEGKVSPPRAHLESRIWKIEDHTHLTQSRPITSQDDQVLFDRAVKILNLGPAIYEGQLNTRSCVKLEPPLAPQQP